MMTILTFSLVSLEKVGNPGTVRNELFSGHINYNLIINISFWNGGFPGKESLCNAGDSGSIPGSGRSPGEGIGYPLPYSWASLVAQLVNNPPAVWETWVQSLGWEDLWKREWLPTPIFWPGEFHGLYSQEDHKELDTTDQLSFSL